MYHRIVLAYDGSPQRLQSLLSIRELSALKNAQLRLVAAVPSATELTSLEYGYQDAQLPVAVREEFERTMGQGLAQLQAAGHQASAQLLVGDAVRQISEHARDFEADLIIVQHVQEKSLLRRWWSDATAKSLVEYAPCNVLIAVATV